MWTLLRRLLFSSLGTGLRSFNGLEWLYLLSMCLICVGLGLGLCKFLKSANSILHLTGTDMERCSFGRYDTPIVFYLYTLAGDTGGDTECPAALPRKDEWLIATFAKRPT